MVASEEQIRELANSIAATAEALASGSLKGPRPAAAARMRNNLETLAAWIPDDD